MARVITEERPRDTVVVEKDVDESSTNNHVGLIVGLIIIGILLILLLIGNPFGRGGGSTDINVTPRAPTAR